MKRRRWWVWAAVPALLVVALGVHVALVLFAPSMKPLRVDPLKPCAAPPPVLDEKYGLALRYAPVIHQKVDPEFGRQDLPAPFDFDGDWRADNNWENFPYYELRPTVYYTVVETETHAFITYHIFHPRDWAPAMVGMQDTHENDGENLQVVVDLGTQSLLLLLTQAHYYAGAHTLDAHRFGSGRQKVTAGFGRFRTTYGWSPLVAVESGGHGIGAWPDGEFFALDPVPAGHVRLRPFSTWGTTWDPPGRVEEPKLPDQRTGYYDLVSLPAKLGRGALRGELTGNGKLFDGAVRYRDDLFDLMVPRYWDGNRYSGPLGNDRGISPFALDFGFAPGEVGALYLNPARRYREMLTITGEWSTTYTYHPWRDGGR